MHGVVNEIDHVCLPARLFMFVCSLHDSYGFDPWQLLAGCVLSSRTSGGETVWAPIRAFHAKFPTPTAVVEEAEINGLERMGKMLKPLGLNRESTISRTALGFLRQWTRPSELYGCGKFAEDSWLAFCHGQVARVASDAAADRNVRAYAIWATKELCAAKALPGPRSLLEGVVGSKLSAAAARRKATKPRWAEEPDSDSYDEDCEGDEGDGDGSDGDDSIQAAGGAGGGLAKAQLLSSVIAEQAHRRQRAAAQASSRQERAARRMATTAASTTSAFSSSSVIGRGDTNDDEKDDDDYLATPRSKPRGKPRASTTTTPRTSSKTTPRALGKAARSGSRQSNNPAVGKAQHVSSKRGRALGGAGGALERALGLVPATPASKRRTPPSSA